MGMEPSFYQGFLQIWKESLWFACQQWVWNPPFAKVSCRFARNPCGFLASNGYGTLVLQRFPLDLQAIPMVFYAQETITSDLMRNYRFQGSLLGAP